jgi:hypothetical protein
MGCLHPTGQEEDFLGLNAEKRHEFDQALAQGVEHKQHDRWVA